MMMACNSSPRKNSLSSFPEAQEIELVLNSLRNGLEEVIKIEREIKSPSTPAWVSYQLKDEAENLATNIKGCAINIIATLSEANDRLSHLNVNCLEYRVNKASIAALSLKFVDLMKVCEKLQIDLQSPLIERVRHGLKTRKISHTQSCKCLVNSSCVSLDDKNKNNQHMEMMTPQEETVELSAAGLPDVVYHPTLKRKEETERYYEGSLCEKELKELRRKASISESVLHLKTAFNEMAVILSKHSPVSRDESISCDSTAELNQAVVVDLDNHEVSLPGTSSKRSSRTSYSLSHLTFSSKGFSPPLPSPLPSPERREHCHENHDERQVMDTNEGIANQEQHQRHKLRQESLLDCNFCSKCILTSTSGFIAILCLFLFLLYFL